MHREGLRKDPMEILSILEKIPRDNRQDPMQLYKIREEFCGILISSRKDPIRQDTMGS